jgi:response regulator of citrate/malate metabolism
MHVCIAYTLSNDHKNNLNSIIQNLKSMNIISPEKGLIESPSTLMGINVDSLPNGTLKTREEMAKELNISSRTMRKYLHKAGINLPKGLLQIPYQNRIRQVILGL